MKASPCGGSIAVVGDCRAWIIRIATRVVHDHIFLNSNDDLNEVEWSPYGETVVIVDSGSLRSFDDRFLTHHVTLRPERTMRVPREHLGPCRALGPLKYMPGCMNTLEIQPQVSYEDTAASVIQEIVHDEPPARRDDMVLSSQMQVDWVEQVQQHIQR